MADQQQAVLTDVPLPEMPSSTPLKDLPQLPHSADKQPLKTDSHDEESPADPENSGDTDLSFKEQSTKLSDLPDSDKKALEEFKQLIREALDNHEFTAPSPLPPKIEEKPLEKKEEPVVEEDPARSETVAANEANEEAEKVVEETIAVKIEAVDEDGAKTVEAIEETVVAVSSSVPPELPEASSDEKSTPPAPPEVVSIYGIPLLADERSDVVLLKFLRARDFKVKDAFVMIKNTVRWRKEFGIDELMEQDLGIDLEKAAFMDGFDKEGHPVCYNVYGEFQDKELYQKTFSDEEKRKKFLRWRIQFLERSIRKLDFTPGGICTIVQVNDLKNSPGPGKKELRQATKQALQLFQDNYPEFVAKQIFINVPWWYLAVNRMMSPFLTHRTKSKFVFAGPSKSAETLLRYITAEQLPVKYGGLRKDGEFETSDCVTEITVKPAAKHTVEFPVTQACELTWEVRVVGWEVSYGAEFVPSAEASYTVIIHKPRKVAASTETVVCDSFKIGEPGKVVLSIDNPTSKKKKLLYRLKKKASH